MIYLDNAATTKPYSEVLNIFLYASENEYFNTAALYGCGVKLNSELASIRNDILNIMHGTGTIIFNSGGTEGTNQVFTSSKLKKKSTILISMAEHDCVINSAKKLMEDGFNVKYIPVNRYGRVIESEYTKLLTEDVSLVSIMHVCNESGTHNDIKRLNRLAKSANTNLLFHSDGVQAFLKTEVSVSDLGVDFYTVSAHKFHGLKGIGFLYIKDEKNIKPLIRGGGQEKGLRSGTVPFPNIKAMYEAIKIGNAKIKEKILLRQEYLTTLREELKKNISDLLFLSDDSSTSILQLAIKDVRGEVLLHALEKHNIIIGTGSACAGRKESLYKKSLEIPDVYKNGIVRLSISSFNNIDEIQYVVAKIADEVKGLRV